ncbi:hypothetical protein [Streptomyces sp. NPDC087294]|uniref:hypothetical protein n=1 Tax=Streptomyces sp. NPDC087294 TaxID=3365777 RepID=UPI00381481C1
MTDASRLCGSLENSGLLSSSRGVWVIRPVDGSTPASSWGVSRRRGAVPCESAELGPLEGHFAFGGMR